MLTFLEPYCEYLE